MAAALHAQGQRHDRIDILPRNGDLGPAARGRGDDGDISVGAKMLSAVSGSILTSLLGMWAHSTTGWNALPPAESSACLRIL
jgi:hypothetical protein